MASSGWYPDPGGQPGLLRFWDGAAWTSRTMPAAPPAPPPAPPTGPPSGPRSAPPSDPPSGPPPATAPAFATSAPQAFPPQAPPSSGGGRRIALVLLAVLLVAGVGVGGFFGVRAITGDDEPSAGGGTGTESSEPTDEPTEDPTDEPTEDPTDGPTEGDVAPEPILDACQGADPVTGATRPGQALRGGGLQVTTPPGYEPSNANQVFTFGDGVAAVGQQVEEFWLSLYALGSLPDIGYESPQQAAETVVECMVRSELFYSGFQGRTDLVSEAVTVDGAEGWQITTEIRVEDPRVTVEGDHATVVVAPREDGTFGLFVSVVPIADDTRIYEQEVTVDELVQ